MGKLTARDWIAIATILGMILGFIITREKDLTHIQDELDAGKTHFGYIEKHFEYDDSRVVDIQKQLNRLERDDRKYVDPQ
jgi:hypothetical protein